MAARKQKGVSRLKKDLWKIFSRVMKLRYSEDGRYVACFTCGKMTEIGTSNCQLGHFLVKSAYPVHYFNENNVRPQCYHCNINKSGDTETFRRHLEMEVGTHVIDELYETRHQKVKRSRQWYLEQIEHYKHELEVLEASTTPP